jgi:hypothetical protein
MAVTGIPQDSSSSIRETPTAPVGPVSIALLNVSVWGLFKGFLQQGNEHYLFQFLTRKKRGQILQGRADEASIGKFLRS